jgi:hypothetical protein
MAKDESSESIPGIRLIWAGARPIIKDQVQHFQLVVLHQRHVMETFLGSLALQVEASILSISSDTVRLVALSKQGTCCRYPASFLRDLRNQVTEFTYPVRRSCCVADQWKRNNLAHVILNRGLNIWRHLFLCFCFFFNF